MRFDPSVLGPDFAKDYGLETTPVAPGAQLLAVGYGQATKVVRFWGNVLLICLIVSTASNFRTFLEI